jgi:hypothetical protein
MASAVQAVRDAQLTNGIVLPAFFINGRYLGGSKPCTSFQQAIDWLAVDT